MDMEINMKETCVDSTEDDPLSSQNSKKQPFFACYLLCSLSPRYKGYTYIGFTVNPRRRIRQHNGEVTSGAWQTKKKRPWEMILCIYGFPSQVSALQFEWAWQNPKKSLAVREAAKSLKQMGGTAGKIKLAYTMLTLPEWKSLNLTVNFLSTKYTSHTKGCPTLPSHMKVQICPVDELPCYTGNWLSDDEDDLGEEHCSGKSDVSDPEEGAEGDMSPAYKKNYTEIKKQQEQKTDQQPPKKCKRRGRPMKQKNSSFPGDELGSKITVSSSRMLSSSTLQPDAQTEGQDNLNCLFANPDSLLQISDSESSQDSYNAVPQLADFRASDSSFMPNTSLLENLGDKAQHTMENNQFINFRTDCSLAKDSEADKPKDISDDFSVKGKMIAASNLVESNLSKDVKIGYSVAKDYEVDKIIDNRDGFSKINGMTSSSNMIEFPSFQEYSPVCYISPLKASEEASLSFISPCKSTPTNKLINANYNFPSPTASQYPVMAISSTPRPVSKGVIDLTDSPAT